MKYIQRANKGRGLELTIERSQINARGRVVTLDKMGTQGRFMKNRQTGEVFMKQVKSPPDFIGCVYGGGREICFDAKECEDEKGFPIRKWARERPLQREWILRQGEAGAIAGLLVEAKAIRRFLWLDWRVIRQRGNDAVVPWVLWEAPAGKAWDDLGDTLHTIDFAKVPGVAGP